MIPFTRSVAAALLLLCTGCNVPAPRQGPSAPSASADSVSTALWGDIDLSTFQLLPEPFQVAEMAPGTPTQFWELRRHWAYMTGPESILERHTGGSPCAGATDRMRCIEAVTRPETREGFMPECHPDLCFFYLISTRGDEVQTWDTEEAALTFFRPIDTPAEAAFVARLNYYFGRGAQDKADGAIRADADGFLLLVTRVDSSCPLRRSRHLIRITPSGNVLPLRRQLIQHDPQTCIVS